MKKVTQVDGQDPWEIEIRFWIEMGMSPDSARALTINRWMDAGELRPLAAAIRSHLSGEHKLHPANLCLLAEMIDDGQLVKPRGRGGQEQPGIFPRDVSAFLLYEYDGKSEEEIADRLGMSPDSVHGAVINVRKAHGAVIAVRKATAKTAKTTAQADGAVK
jgi:hypothetical protein